MGQRLGTVEIWDGDRRLPVHPRPQKAGQRFTQPGQWEGLVNRESGPRREAVAVQIPAGQVERRSLEVFELAATGGGYDRIGTGPSIPVVSGTERGGPGPGQHS